jgi:hypothetical protein
LLKTLNEEALLLFGVVPNGLFGHFMVEHISKGRKDLSLVMVNINPKNPTTHHHPGPIKLLKRIFLSKLFGNSHNGIIILPQINNLLSNLQ